jgi:drug/metabolite transporter superfamily protein YnfA
MIILFPIALAVAVLEIAAIWILFTKAGQPGWGSLIPIFNLYLWLQMANRPTWWLLLYLIPIVNLVIAVIVHLDVAKAFGKSTAYGVLFILFAVIVTPILAFGPSTYTRPVR